jgi:hypothetical protein
MTSTRLLRCRTRWRPWERQARIAAAASEARIAAAAPKCLREAAGRRKRTATRLLRCRTRWRPWERPAFIRAVRRGCYVFARGGARGSAKRGNGGALRRVARLQQIVLLRGAASVL